MKTLNELQGYATKFGFVLAEETRDGTTVYVLYRSGARVFTYRTLADVVCSFVHLIHG